MIDGLKPYPAYKDSGVEWLGEVPTHWEIRRLGSSVRGCVNGVWGSEPNGKDDLPCVRVADFDRSRLRVHLDKPTMRAISSSDRVRRLLEPGDLLLEKSGGGDLQPVGRVVLYDHPTVAVTSNFIARMPVENGYDSIYLTYLHAALYSIELTVRSIKQTTGIQNLDSRTYLSELVAFPPLPEQTAIVRFLDYMDLRMRRYIRAKQKLIKLLEEYKQALIHQAVTGKIDVRTGQPYPAYKPSGVEWLGEVPAHWEVRRLKHICRLVYGDALPDADAEIEPVPTVGGRHRPEPELDRLTNTIKAFNDQFGNIPWTDADRVHKLITEEIPARVAADTAYQNARKNSDKQNARIEHDKALVRVMTALLKDDTELFKQFSDNESFRRWLTDTVFALTYSEPGSAR